jgi:hypothetical protein
MGAGATSFRRLVSAFHDISKKLGPEEIRETDNYLKFLRLTQIFISQWHCAAFSSAHSLGCPVDNFLIKCVFMRQKWQLSTEK